MQTIYKESTVRSFDIVSKNGVRYQLWIDSIKDGEVTIKAWDYKKRTMQVTGKVPEALQLLEHAYFRVKEWIKNDN